MREPPRILRAARVLATEILVYAGLVGLYLLLVFKTLRPWLTAQAARHGAVYALWCILLMLGQGVLLELLTAGLVRRFAKAREGQEDQEETP